jgi:folylpolyglutamate synthase
MSCLKEIATCWKKTGFLSSLFLKNQHKYKIITMESSRSRLHSYNEAIKALNGLQTNAAVLEKVKEERLKNYVNNNLAQMKTCLVNSGMTMEALNSLKVIHVSGTKGKGSTCAFTESILRYS